MFLFFFLFFYLFFYIKSASLHQTQLTERNESDIYIYEILNSILSCRFFCCSCCCVCVCVILSFPGFELSKEHVIVCVAHSADSYRLRMVWYTRIDFYSLKITQLYVFCIYLEFCLWKILGEQSWEWRWRDIFIHNFIEQRRMPTFSNNEPLLYMDFQRRF